MQGADFLTLYTKALDNVIREIETYTTPQVIWKKDHQVNNSAGTLALHICGNLLYFIGNGLGSTGYARNREAEFSTVGLSQTELVKQLTETKHVLQNTLNTMNESDLQHPYRLETPFGPVSNELLLLYLLAHLNYHGGQISYHRRLLDAK